MIYIALGLVFIAIVCSGPIDRSFVAKEKRNPLLGVREREIRAWSGWRIAITWLSRDVRAPLICFFFGHVREFAAFHPIAVCRRCARVVREK